MNNMIEESLLYYKQLDLIFDDLHIGVFTVDSERKITSFNRAAEIITGYKKEDVVGQYCFDVFLNDLCYGDCKYHNAVEEEQGFLSFDVEITDSQNVRRLITKIVAPLYGANRDLLGCIEIFQDHSVFEEMFNRIIYDERRMKMILDNLEVGVFTVNLSGHITFFSTLAEAITGYNRKEVLGKTFSMLFGGEESSDVALLKESMKDERPRSSTGLMTTKDKRNIPIRAKYMALKNERARTVGGLVTFQDLSVIFQLSRELQDRFTFADMIGRDPKMQKLFEMIPVVAASEATVLVEGATGTGKDLIAKVIHNVSRRAEKPFVKVNCAALPDNLLESEMFGYIKGAFTGADRDKPGRFQDAEGGTIFLDEIGDLPLSLQAKLLRVLEDKEFYPLGSRKTTKVDVRIIAATNQGLERLVAEKRFREDLFYRLNVIRLELPLLRERKGDIPLLISHIVNRLSALKETTSTEITKEAMEVLLNHDYPGNIRELQNILEHALIICQEDDIDLRHLPLYLKERLYAEDALEEAVETIPAGGLGDERQIIMEALKRHKWNRGKAAKELNMHRSTLWRKIKKYSLF